MATYDDLMVDIGNAPDDDQGDPLRTAFDKINQRFAELRVFLNNRGDWAPSTVYTANPNRDWVIVDGVGYLATSNHTSGATFAADLAAGRWVEADALLAIAEVDELRADLASTAAGKGAELVAFIQDGTGAVQRTLQNKARESVSVKDFGAVGDGVTDDTAAIQAAIDYVAALSGPSHDGSMSTQGQPPAFTHQYGQSRVLDLAGMKCLISNTITLKNSVTVFGRGGGFIADPSFPATGYMVDMDWTPYSGNVQDLVLDGNGQNVKGIRIRSAHHTRWTNITVAGCRNDGIVFQDGSEFVLNGFSVDCHSNPVSNSVAGLRVLGSDCIFSNGACRFNPIGVHVSGGGNNEFNNVHPWGLYSGQKQYINFFIENSYRNTFVSCYGDSPTKQDYTKGNEEIVGGVPNGGVCFYFANGAGGSQGNALIGCRGYVNWGEYTTAGHPAGALLWSYMESNAVGNQTVTPIYAGGAPYGDTEAFPAMPHGYYSNSVKDANIIIGSESPLLPRLAVSRDAGGGLADVIIENTNNAFASSGSKVSFAVAGAEVASVSAIQGAGTISPIVSIKSGASAVKLNWDGVFYPNADNAQNLGSGSSRWGTVFSGTGTINTSDRREKQDIAVLDDVEKRVAVTIKGLFRKFRFNDAVSNKGDQARIHVGVIAQDVMAAFQAEGLDPMRYAIVCYNEWPAELDDDGNEVTPAGSRYGVRYEQLLAFVIAAL